MTQPTDMQSLIVDDEGSRIWPYVDTAGHRSWGVGHDLDAEPVAADVAALLNQAVLLQFQHDLDAVLAVASTEPWWTSLNDVRQASIADMLFNLGVRAIQTFGTFFGYIAAQRWTDAAADLRTTKVYRQLPTRYERLATIIETGQWPT